MQTDQIFALASFLIVATGTPGPNNAMLAASGARFGFRRTWPHAMGVAIGFPAMLFAIALGLGEVFKQSALLREGLRLVGAAIMLWIAWMIATAPVPSRSDAAARPFTFFEAAAFQWINPKAWVMCIGVVSQYLTGQAVLAEAALCAVVAFIVSIPSSHGWTGFGAALQRWLAPPLRWRSFSVAMAGVIVLGVAYLMVWDAEQLI